MRNSNKVLLLGAVLMLSMVLCTITGVLTPSWVVNLVYLWRVGWPIIIGCIFLAVAFIFSLIEEEASDSEALKYMLLKWLSVLLGLVCIILVQSGRAYAVGRAYLPSMTIVEAETFDQGFGSRFLHYDNAVNSLRNSMGTYYGTTLRNVTYVDGKWTGIADGQTFKVPLKAVVSLGADGNIERCDISTDTAIEGKLEHALINKIRWEESWWIYVVNTDIYGECNDGHGKIYIPFYKLTSIWGIPVPYGLAVMDELGNIDYYYDSLPSDIVGPAYPESIARSQESSLDTANGYIDWIFSNYGYEETTADTNSENFGQYNLSAIGTQEYFYVTPLTAKGESLSLVGMSVIESSSVSFGKINNGVFVKYPEAKVGIQELSDATKSYYKFWPWVNLEIQEIIPAEGTTFVGYVGRPTQLDYMVTYLENGAMTAVRISPEVSSDIVTPADVAPTPSMTPTVVINEAVPVTEVCIALWVQMQQATDEKNLSQVLTVSSELVRNNCK